MIGNAVFYPGSAVVNTRLTGGILYALREGSVAAGRDPRGDQADQRAAIRPTRFDSGML